jgi:hypothetical protein
LHVLCATPDNDASAGPAKKTRIEPLPKVDHSTIMYAPFQKKFYTEHADIANMSVQEVAAYRGNILFCCDTVPSILVRMDAIAMFGVIFCDVWSCSSL